MTAPSFFSYSRVFDTEETVYYRGADGQLAGGGAGSVMGSVGVLNVVQHVPVGQELDVHAGGSNAQP